MNPRTVHSTNAPLLEESHAVSTFGIDTSSTSVNENQYVRHPSSAGKRRWNRRMHRPTSSSLSSLFLLLLLWALIDDSPSLFFVKSQSSPSTPTTIVVTPTPVSRPTAPTRRPTSRPVASTDTPTTDPPTPNPTEEQSDTPTPTLQPMLPPSPSPTQTPQSPTANPTISSKPISITLMPTISARPSPSPVNSPVTAAPVEKPTRKPVTTPPSPSPSYAPSNAPQIKVVSVSTLLERTYGKLEGKATFDFESVTEAFILAQLRSMEQSLNVRFTQLEVNVYGQSVATSTRRRLQSDLIRLQVTYNTLVVFQSSDGGEDYPVEEWIGTAFNNRTKRNLYISKLQAANNDAFSAVERVTVSVDGEAPTTVDEDKSTNVWSNETLWIIVGAVGGTLSLLIIVSTLYIMGRRRRKYDDEMESAGPHGRGKHSISNETRPIPQALSYDSDSQNRKFSAEIDVDFQTDDVSTLGDPTYYGGAMDQRTVAPNGAPYAVPSRGRLLSDDDDDLLLTSAESNLSKQNDNDIVVRTVVEQDTSFTRGAGRKFAVEVPPGKLGMIIDSPVANEPPVVHTIKPESILVATVQAGDLLLAVDGRDVTQYTAVQVSQLISAQSDQQRTLIFLRKLQPQRERFHSTSSETEEQNGAC